MVMRKRFLRIPARVLALVLTSGLLAGCFGAVQKPSAPAASLGVVDMDKVFQAHPKQAELENLQRQYLALEEQLMMLQSQAAMTPSSAGAGDVTAEEKEFNAKMAARQQELQERFDQKLNVELSRANELLQSYGDQLEKELQPELFSLQLKLNALQNSPAEAAQLTSRMDAIKKDYQERMSVRQTQLNAEVDQNMSPEKQAVEKQLREYAAQVQNEIQARLTSQRTAASRLAAPADGAAGELQRALGMKRTEVETLQEFIRNDVRSKAAKLAAERNLEMLLTGYRVNLTAVDLTAAVTAEVKK